MSDKWPGSGTACDGIQHRRFHLDIAHIIQIIPQMLDELRTDNEVLLYLRVHHQIHIPLTEPQFLVLQAVELFRQRQQGLGQQNDILGANAHLAPLGAERLALNADNITDVILLELLIDCLVHLVLTGVKLNSAIPVLQIAEGDLTHAALAHQPSRHFNGLALHLVKVILDLLRGSIPIKARDLKGILALGLKICQLFPANTGLLRQAQLRLGLRILLFSHRILLSARSLRPYNGCCRRVPPR